MNETLKNAVQTYSNDVQIVQDVQDIYSNFQDYLRKCYKNEKTLNKILIGLPENAQTIDPDDLNRLIQKAESAHLEVHDLYTNFATLVKNECVMNVHFFSFTGIPELIVRKNYTRKQYDLLVKLLNSVKNEYLEQRAKTEADNVEEQEKVKQNAMQKHNTE